MIHGRFQPFHNGHLTYARLAKKLCDFMIIGITNPDSRSYVAMAGDSDRHLAASNPYTYYERQRMINKSLPESDFPHGSFIVVPFPIDNPALWSAYAPENVTMFLRDRGAWTKTKITMLETKGWNVVTINDAHDLEIHGKNIRTFLMEHRKE